MKPLIINIKTVPTNDLGSLSFFEENHDIDFEIKRIYYIYNVPVGIMRGGHAHKKLCQLLFCPYGSIKIFLDDGYEKCEVLLDDPSKGLLIEKCQWRDMLWLIDNSVLCVAASDYYNEEDYIRNYDEFIKYVHKENKE